MAPGALQFVILIIVILLLFGKRLPSVMFSLGKSVNTFKEGMNTDTDDEEVEEVEVPRKKKKSVEAE